MAEVDSESVSRPWALLYGFVRYRFSNRTRCLQHMNQPNGRCHGALHPAVLRAAQTITEKRSPPPEYYKGAAQKYGQDKTFMEAFNRDTYAKERRTNIYYPFASVEEWEIASFITRSNMTVAATNEFLKLRLTANINLSFATAKDLRSRMEILPQGPVWKAIPWKTRHPTKTPLTLYYRDPVECLQSLLNNPLAQDFIQYSPFRLWATSKKLMRIYTEWLSGDVAWRLQDKFPEGATVLGSILSSDKTQLSAMTGNRQAHPLLISTALLDMDFRMKASHHAFLLLALLSIPKFREKNREIRGVLESRLFHAMLDFILLPLKKTAEIGTMMTDPLASHTLSQLIRLEQEVNPWDLSAYIKLAKERRLNGVHRPFWRDWRFAEPFEFLTPEILHHWLKMFYDHLCKWCIEAVGADEIDFRFSILRPHTGMRHFKEGISKGKQTTGREHRDILRYIVPVIAGAVSKVFLTTIAAFSDFFYHGQAEEISEDILSKMSTCLKAFHDNKKAILKAGARRGKKGPIDNWHIPKLEFLQSVIPAIRANGVPLQWSADVTEHAHITLVKDPAYNSNNQKYEPQICRHLDRRDKCARFDLATAISTAGVDFGAREPADLPDDPSEILDDEPSLLLNRTSELLDQIEPVSRLSGTSRADTDYFSHSSLLIEGRFSAARKPFRTFTSADGNTAFHLAREHVGHQLTVDAAATKFRLPDLRPALAAYLHRPRGSRLVIGGRRPTLNDERLPFEKIEVWHTVRIQSRAFHNPKKILVPMTVNAAPPDATWTCGRADAVLVNSDSDFQWPRSGLEGHIICQLRMIFHVVPWKGCNPPSGTDGFLAYVQRFDVVPQTDPTNKVRGAVPEPASRMYQLKRARRSDRSIMGDIIPLDRLRALADLAPRFGKTADRRLTKENSLDYCEEFSLSKWFNKEFFFALSQ
ncbi:hypothetical protein B0H17DRAFT_1171830 [Mycena rosella]|uniref:DUF6830 domain-containing protein n=1 Tax=Mycena rosella TaxID=1033263 RepID=A0AAD7CQT3_MYCRO|nr:hypothetical protein B0H17DRAFT_1171830 [Mycena rosella]